MIKTVKVVNYQIGEFVDLDAEADQALLLISIVLFDVVQLLLEKITSVALFFRRFIIPSVVGLRRVIRDLWIKNT